MKNMKYIKLFEAFDASIVNKILGYVSSKDKNLFLDKIKSICKNFDVPESKLSDDLFKYLPYNAAIAYNGETIADVPCDAVGEFIAGERCKDGKVKRPWGKGFRYVDCSACNGTGIKKQSSNLKLLKFWFDKDGKFITTTAVDGVYRTNNADTSSATNTVTFSPNIDDYDVVRKIPKSRINDLNTGDIIALDLVDNTGWNNRIWSQVVSYVMKTNTWAGIKTFALQNTATYYNNYPRDTYNWNQIASRYWQMSQSRVNNISLLRTKEVKSKKNPLGYNTSFNFSKFTIIPSSILSFIKDANFAIVFEYSKFISLVDQNKYKLKGDIRDERREVREGALALMKDADIKKANIQRYMSLIADRMKIQNISDISNLTRLASKLMCNDFATYRMAYNSNYVLDRINTISSYLFKVIKLYKKAERDDNLEEVINGYEFKNYIESVNMEISQGIKNATDARYFYIDRLKEIKYLINNQNDEELKNKSIKVLDNIDRLSKEINKYINVFEVKNLEDIELLYQELAMIADLLRSDRVGLRIIDGFFDRMRLQSSYNEPTYIWARLKEKSDYYGNINNNINYLINILRKKQSLVTREFDEE
jgi:hypothetical protein